MSLKFKTTLKYLALILFAFVLHEFAYSQDQRLTDSLENALKRFNAYKLEIHGNTPEKNDTVKVNILFELSKAYWYNNFEKSIEYANQSLQLAEQISYKRGIIHAYYTMGVINYIKGNYVQGLIQSKKSLTLAEELKDQQGIADAYINIGNITMAQGSYPEALKYYFTSLKISEKIGYKMGVVYNYTNLGILYSTKNNYPEALKYFFASLKIKKEIGDRLNMANDYQNIASIYANQGNNADAIKYYTEATKIDLETGNKIWESYDYGNVGDIYFKQGLYSEALKNYFVALKMAKESDNNGGIAVWFNNIGDSYRQLKNYRDARKYLNDELVLSKKLELKELIKSNYNSLTELDSATGNWQSAYENHKLFMLYSDSLVNEENTKTFVEATMQNEFDKKELAAKSLQEKKDINAKAEIQKQKLIKYSSFGALIALMLLAFGIYKRFNEKRKANVVLVDALQNLKDTQEQLILSEKMAAFGVLAQRMAHEIQNPLNFVNNFSEISEELAHEIMDDSNVEEKKEIAQRLLVNVQKINHHGKNASTIVKKLQDHIYAGTAHEFFEEIGSKKENIK